ncbi:MAG: restriction endonuclease, partial [Helicobacteraceae bacterium]|nr:restriction endonuclease [Helicobacteraceae bacterium]
MANQSELLDEFWFLDQNLFAQAALREFPSQIEGFKGDITALFGEVKNLWHSGSGASSEADLEMKFVSPVLDKLGWSYNYQQSAAAQGKRIKPDFTLFENKEDGAEAKDDIEIALQNGSVRALCESKFYDVALDNKTVDKNTNPHFQLLDYCNAIKCDVGFLTNGELWRFYDATKFSSQKVY